MIALPLFFFALGAVCASFIGLVAARLHTGASLVHGRSECDACGVALNPLALIPIVSWAVLQGRCISCRAYVGPASTIAELVLGALFVVAYLKLGLSLLLPLVLVALVLLAGLVLYDLAHAILPPVLLYPFVLVALGIAALSSSTFTSFFVTWFTALLLGSVLALVHLFSKGRAMGFADAPLTVGLAFLAGKGALLGFLFSFWIGGFIGILLLFARATGTKINSEVPFAPFLAAGFLIVYFTSWDFFTLLDHLQLLYLYL